MKKQSNLQKLIREELNSAIPAFAVRQIAEECAEAMKRLMINHINTKSTSQKERQQMTVRMNKIMEDVEDEIKDLLDEKLSDFLNR
jgi:ATP-dependent RNA circularization protein (DNA/RNA ligase family)